MADNQYGQNDDASVLFGNQSTTQTPAQPTAGVSSSQSNTDDAALLFGSPQAKSRPQDTATEQPASFSKLSTGASQDANLLFGGGAVQQSSQSELSAGERPLTTKAEDVDPNAPWYKRMWEAANAPIFDEKAAKNWFGWDIDHWSGWQKGLFDLASGLTSPLSIGLAIGTFGSSSLIESGGMAALKGVMAADDIAQVAKGSEMLSKALRMGHDAETAFATMEKAGINSNTVKMGLDTLAKAGMKGESLIANGIARRTGGAMLRQAGVDIGTADKIGNWTQMAMDAGFTMQNAYGAVVASPQVLDAIKEGDYDRATRLAIDAVGSGAFAVLGGRQVHEHAGEMMTDAESAMGLRVKPSDENIKLMKLLEPIERERVIAGERERNWEQSARKQFAEIIPSDIVGHAKKDSSWIAGGANESDLRARFFREAEGKDGMQEWYNAIAEATGREKQGEAIGVPTYDLRNLPSQEYHDAFKKIHTKLNSTDEAGARHEADRLRANNLLPKSIPYRFISYIDRDGALKYGLQMADSTVGSAESSAKDTQYYEQAKQKLGPKATFSEISLEAQKMKASDGFDKLVADIQAGKVYHGTTEKQAESIRKGGLAGLSVNNIVQQVAKETGVDISTLSPEQKEELGGVARSYNMQLGKVSFTHSPEVAKRWAGKGGEIAARVRAILTGSDKMESYPIDTVPHILEGTLSAKGKESAGYQRLLREVQHIQDDLAKGTYDKETAYKHLSEAYHDIRVAPEDVELKGGSRTPSKMSPEIREAVDSGKLKGKSDKYIDQLLRASDPRLLSDREIEYSKHAGEHFDETGIRAVGEEALAGVAEAYVTRVLKDPEADTIRKFRSVANSPEFSVNTAMARKRIFQTTLESVLKGYELADHDMVSLAAHNGNEFSRVASNRQALRRLRGAGARASDGRPMTALSGSGHVVEGMDEEGNPVDVSTIINPKGMQSIRMANKIVEGLRNNVIRPAEGGSGIEASRMTPKDTTSVVQSMVHPEKFLNRVGDAKGVMERHDVDLEAKFKGATQWPSDVPPVKLVLDEGGNVIDADGRYRASLANQAGIKQIPVEITRKLPKDSGVQKAVSDSGKVKLGADVASLGKVLGSSLYGGRAPKVIVKELLQNAFDAVRMSPGHKDIHVDIDSKTGQIKVSDTGLGMTKRELETVFTDLGSSGKRDQAGASGGFGLAKAAPLMMSESLTVSTTVDEGGRRMQHTFTATPDQMLGEGVEIRSREVGKDVPTGTDIISRLTKKDQEDYWAMNDARKQAKDAMKSIKSPGEITYFENGKPQTVDHAPLETKPLARGSANGADFDIYKSNEPLSAQEEAFGSIPVEINNNGIHQFSTHVYLPDGMDSLKGVPKRLVADVKANVEEGHPDYPFLANRESLRPHIDNAIRALVKQEILDPAMAKYRQSLGDVYHSLPRMPGTDIPILDSGGRLTPAELKEIQNHPVVKQIAKAIRDTAKDAIQIARDAANAEYNAVVEKSMEEFKQDFKKNYLRDPTAADLDPDNHDFYEQDRTTAMKSIRNIGLNIKRIGLVFDDKLHGVFIPDPRNPGESSIFINPFSVRTNSPWNAASLIWHTIKHEIVHDLAKGHNENFTTIEKDFSYSQGSHEITALKRFKELYENPSKPGTLHPELDRPFQLYKESRGREESTPDILGGESLRERGKSPSGSEDSDAGGVRQGRTGSVPRPAVTELDKLIKEGRVVKYGQDKKGRDLYAWTTHDYRTIDNPSFKGWKVPTVDTDGNPVYVQGELRVHPEAHEYLQRRFGTDEGVVKKIPGVKTALKLGGEAKGFLLAFSPFHFVQEGLRAVMTGISPIGSERFNPNNPMHVLAAEKGVWSSKDYKGVSAFEEGLVGHSKVISKVPVLREIQSATQSMLFDRYIPGLKLRAFTRVYEANKSLHPEWSKEKLGNESAAEVNERFGGIDYKRMGRSAAAMDLARLTTLAPDWLESEIRFMKRTFTPGEEGTLARRDMAKMTLGLWAAARVLNYLTTGKAHNEAPFGVAYKDDDGREKVYSIRTMPSDMLHAVSDPLGFMNGRVAPLLKTGIQTYTGRDEFGRKMDHNQIFVNLLRNVSPIGLQTLVKQGTGQGTEGITNVDQGLKAAGLTVFPYRTEAQKLAAKIASDHSESGQVDPDKLKRHQGIIEIEDRVRLGKMPLGDVYKAVESGQIHIDEAKKIIKNIQETAGMDNETARFYSHAARLPLADLIQVWDKAGNEEKAAISKLILKKKTAYLKKAFKDMSPAERQSDKTYQWIRRNFPTEQLFQ